MALRKDLQEWRGELFSEEELQGFNIWISEAKRIISETKNSKKIK